jgi:Na+-driven multidrug efflux pump
MTAHFVAIIATLLAALMSMADSALLATHTSPEHAWDADSERNRREREHRALAMARVILYLTAGAAIAQVFALWEFAAFPRLLIQIGLALVVAAVTESAARAIGQGNGHKVGNVVAPVTGLAIFALAPVVALGSRLEKLLYFILPPPKQLASFTASFPWARRRSTK